MRHYVAKEKQVYSSMNNFKLSGSVLVGYAWIPKEDVTRAENALLSLSMKY
jgi:vacuolar-type H+-ATPase subunit I/STV1